MSTDGEQSTTEIDSFVIGTLSIDDSFTPNKISISGNFPNPFNPITQIRYDLPKDNLVNITIYDIQGRKIRTLINIYQVAKQFNFYRYF